MSMEATENKCAPSTHQKKAKKLKKLRRWQITVSLLAIAVMGWGVIQVVCLFLNYKRTEVSNDAHKIRAHGDRYLSMYFLPYNAI